MPEWDAEVVVDEPLVRALLHEQFPQLDASSARLLGEGWDNSVWTVEERWAFRFPRRRIAIPGVLREIALLPALAPLLPVPIPAPVFVGEPNDRFPWPFFGTPLLSGVEPAAAPLNDDERVTIGAQLAGFLRVLHAPETLELVDPAGGLPVDFNRRVDMSFRVMRTRELLGRLTADLWRVPDAVEDLLEHAAPLPPADGGEVLVHGDLHIRHVLVDRGELAGVIDWGDLCRADPAVDLLLYWCLLGPDARAAFVAAYGPIPDERLLRGRILSLFLCASLLEYAHREGFAGIEAEARAGLERTLRD